MLPALLRHRQQEDGYQGEQGYRAPTPPGALASRACEYGKVLDTGPRLAYQI